MLTFVKPQTQPYADRERKFVSRGKEIPMKNIIGSKTCGVFFSLLDMESTLSLAIASELTLYPDIRVNCFLLARDFSTIFIFVDTILFLEYLNFCAVFFFPQSGNFSFQQSLLCYHIPSVPR